MKKTICRLALLIVLLCMAGMVSAYAVTNGETLDTSYIEGREQWTYSANSQVSWGPVYRMFDGNLDTYWHTNYTASGSTIIGHDVPPFTVDIKLPVVTTTAGISYVTRGDSTSGIWLEFYLYGSESDTGELVQFYHGFFDDGKSTKTRFFDANIRLKRLRIEIVDSDGGYATGREFYLVSPFDNFTTMNPAEYPAFVEESGIRQISTEKASVAATHECWADNYPKLVLDGREGRFWQSEESSNYPFLLTIDLNDPYEISQINFTPRQTGDWHGTWLTFNILTSMDGNTYKKVASNLHMAKSTRDKVIFFDKPVEARCVRFEITSGYVNRAACAELRFYESKESYKKRLREKSECYILQVGNETMSKTKGTASSEVTLSAKPMLIGGLTFVPLRDLFEQMGAAITWRDEDQTITIARGAYTVTMQIWNNLITVAGTRYGTVRYTLQQCPRIIDGHTYVPLRFVSEYFGYNVKWDGGLQTVTITNNEMEASV